MGGVRPKRKRSAVEPLNLSLQRSRARRESGSHISWLDSEDEEEEEEQEQEQEGDRDYMFFLKRIADPMGGDVDEGSYDRLIEYAKSSDEDEDNYDPQYLSFLEHLKEDGKSYVLAGEGKNGEIVLHKYEPELNLGSEGLNLRAKRLEPVRAKRLEPVRAKSAGVSIKKKSVASAKNSRRVLRSDTSMDLQDPGNSKDTSGRKGNDKAIRIPKESSRRRQECYEEVPASPVRRVNDKAVRIPKESSRRQECYEEVPASPVRKGNDKAVRIPKESSRRRQECYEAVPASTVREDCKRKAPQPRHVKSSEKQQEEPEQWDDSYMVFLQHVRNDGEVLLFNHDSRTVRYEEDEPEPEESSSSDVEILAPEDILENEGNNPFVTTRMASIDLEAADPGESDHSEFRVELLKELNSPYNVEEYNDLLQKVKHRRRKEVIREMRGGREASYRTKRSCPSYLDQYTDLADKLFKARGDLPRRLNILRGFFFYLSRITMEGRFRPWMDQSCMSILPPIAPGLGEQIPLPKAARSNKFPPTPQLGKQTPCVKAEPPNNFPPTPQLGKQIPCVKAEPLKISPPTPQQFGKPLQCIKVERP